MPPIRRALRPREGRLPFTYHDAEKIGIEKLEHDMKEFKEKIRPIVNQYGVPEIGVHFYQPLKTYTFSSHGPAALKFLKLIANEAFSCLEDCTRHLDIDCIIEIIQEELDYIFDNIQEFSFREEETGNRRTIRFEAMIRYN